MWFVSTLTEIWACTINHRAAPSKDDYITRDQRRSSSGLIDGALNAFPQPRIVVYDSVNKHLDMRTQEIMFRSVKSMGDTN